MILKLLSEGKPLEVSLGELARKLGLPYTTTRRAVKELAEEKVIFYFPAKNQWVPGVMFLNPQIFHRKGGNLSEVKRSTFGEPYNVNNDSKNKYIKNVKWLARGPEEALALEVAKTLGDEKNLGLYLSYCRKYPRDIILRAFGEAKETPEGRIKRSRGALFTYLVKRYAQREKNSSWDRPRNQGDGGRGPGRG